MPRVMRLIIFFVGVAMMCFACYGCATVESRDPAAWGFMGFTAFLIIIASLNGMSEQVDPDSNRDS